MENDLNMPPLPDESGGPIPVECEEGTGPGGAYEPLNNRPGKGFAIVMAGFVSLLIVVLVRSCS